MVGLILTTERELEVFTTDMLSLLLLLFLPPNSCLFLPSFVPLRLLINEAFPRALYSFNFSTKRYLGVLVSSVAQSCSTLCDPMDCSTPGFLFYHQLPELIQTHVRRVSDVIQQSYPLLSPSPPTFNLSQHQGLYKWVSSSHQVAKVLEFQLQHQSFQWIFRTDFL